MKMEKKTMKNKMEKEKKKLKERSSMEKVLQLIKR